ncbi:MAG: hypothetical protein OXB92_08575 [Acidimicrobiaceae bacterium]|nr:hypothetical protein [Acidimicrobiaceae bacterium]
MKLMSGLPFSRNDRWASLEPLAGRKSNGASDARRRSASVYPLDITLAG